MASLSPDSEVIPECEVLGLDMEGDEEDRAKMRWENCTKNRGHHCFIPVNDFRMEHLPVGKRTPKMMEDVFIQSALTVRIRVTYTSKERLDTFADSDVPYPYIQYRGTAVIRFGTGRIKNVYYHRPVKGMRCPCPECKDSDNPKTQFWWILVQTSNHVIFDRSEAECAELECFYDSEEKAQVKKLYGFDIFNYDSNLSYRLDVCNLTCVTHDNEVVAILNRVQPTIFQSVSDSAIPVIVSHPHGRSKHITVGDILHLTVPLGPKYPVNTAIPFRSGTIFREQCQTGTGSQTDGTGSSQKSDFFKQSDANTLKDRLEAIRASLDLPKEDNTTNAPSVIPPPQTKDGYLLEHYNAHIRDMFLYTAVWSTFGKMKAGKSGTADNIWINTIDYVSKRFLGLDSGYDCQESREEDLALEREGSERGKDGGKVKADEVMLLGKWEELLARNEELYVQYLKDKTHGGAGGGGFGVCGGYEGGTVPVIVRAYEEFGNSMDSIKSELANKGEIITQDIIRNKMETDLSFWFKRMNETIERDWNESTSESENITTTTKDDPNEEFCGDQKQTVGEKKSNHFGDRNRKKEEGGEERESAVGTIMDGKAEREKEDQQGEGRGDNGGGEGGRKGRRRGGGETMWLIPEGAGFILPSDSEYAYRAKPGNPEWFSFPSGTLMISPADADGVKTLRVSDDPVPIGEPLYEFCLWDTKNWLLDLCYLTYNTPTCPGSSGANIYYRLPQETETNFPHAGSVKVGVNRSGIENIFHYAVFSES